ncbi:hypothetical protein TSOC_008003 [Tetrabaena socialis]|uniref:Uncharacterized protein n=1 Tax=Tetrabaena socialis TaxID=47790 RepID=A0A2J7ZZN2_9CHLO|nr:hypothetical protein TSOC_008003 [Tetrabaena socialis]|eukprot:PNH05698.1 hypothetical protein TSOC_008003 [Tetrabaena socialis]
MASVLKSAMVGDVTAVHVARMGPRADQVVMLAGCGPQLLVYDLLHGGRLLAVQHVMGGCRIHGIATTITARPASGPGTGQSSMASDGDGPAAAAAAATAWVVVYGDRWVSCVQSYDQPHRQPHGQPVEQPSAAAGEGAGVQARPPEAHEAPLLLVLALADNTAEVWHMRQPPPPPPPHHTARPREHTNPQHHLQQQQQQQQQAQPVPHPDAAPAPAVAPAPPLLEARCLVAAECAARMQLFSAAILPLRLASTGELRMWLAAGPGPKNAVS